MANKYKKRCLTLLIAREIQIKTTMRCHLTLVRMAMVKMSTSNKCWRDCGEKGALLHSWWECKLVQPLGEHDVLCVLVTQSCRTLCDPTDCSPTGSSVHGILQARVLEWVFISFSRRTLWKFLKKLKIVTT